MPSFLKLYKLGMKFFCSVTYKDLYFRFHLYFSNLFELHRLIIK